MEPGRRAPARWSPAAGLLLVAPTMLVIVTFTLLPVVIAIVSSLTHDREFPGSIAEGTFVGLRNYERLFADPDFLRVLSNTTVFVVSVVGISVPLALFMALALNRAMIGVGPLRSAAAYPTFLPMVGAGAMWLFLYNLNFGLVNDVLGRFGIPAQNWLGDPELALPAIAVMTVWRMSSCFMIFYLAGLQALPRDVVEAASVDGAGVWQTLRRVTVPLLRPTTLFVTITAFVVAFQTYDQVAVMTKDGGPANATNMLLFNARLSFGYGYYDQANAQTVLLVIVLFAFTAFYYLYSERRTTYLGD